MHAHMKSVRIHSKIIKVEIWRPPVRGREEEDCRQNTKKILLIWNILKNFKDNLFMYYLNFKN